MQPGYFKTRLGEVEVFIKHLEGFFVGETNKTMKVGALHVP